MADYVSLPTEVLNLAIRSIPDDVQAGMRQMGGRAVLAGGFIRSLATQLYLPPAYRRFIESGPKDLDIFVPNMEGMSEMASYLAQRECVGHHRYFHGMPAWRGTLTFRPRDGESPEVQVIGEWAFTRPTQVIAKFDFSVSSAAIWWTGSEWEGTALWCWLEDVKMRIAHYRSRAPNPAGTLLRLPRYLGLGYHVRPESLTVIAARAAKQARRWYKRNAERRNWTRFNLADALLEMCTEELISPPADSVPPWNSYLLAAEVGGSLSAGRLR